LSFRRDWNAFWFTDTGAGPVGLLRIAMGTLVIAAILQLWPDRFAWFSERGLLPTAESDLYNAAYTAGPRPIDFLYGASADWQINLFFVVYFIAALFMTAGFWTRPAIFLVWLGLSTIHNRDSIVNTTGGDQVMIIMTIYLLFARSDAAFSVRRLMRIRRGLEGDAATPIPVWPQRLMQIQVSIVYLATFLNKLVGSWWDNGTAVYYPYTLLQFHRFPVPFMDGDHMLFINLLTYITLATELSLGTLVWVPRLRFYVLGAGVFLHASIEYSLNIPLFAALMISSYLSFLTQQDLLNFKAWLQRRLGISVPTAAQLARHVGGPTLVDN
jgi:uncharacterized membrane protein